MVSLKKWTFWMILISIMTLGLSLYVISSYPSSSRSAIRLTASHTLANENEKRCCDHAFSLINVSEFQRQEYTNHTKVKNVTAAHMSQYSAGYLSWNKGVVTQLYPLVKRNCTKLLAGDKTETVRVAEEMLTWKNRDSCEDLLAQMSDCNQIQEEFSNSFYVSAEEKKFPIAYILVVYTNPKQIVRFLKAVYRPHNIYCIHPDHKSGRRFSTVFHLLSMCLHNVFVASHIERVVYARSSIFDAQLSCYRDLDKYPVDSWHYVINLCGRELPLKTNREIVKYLKERNGTSVLWTYPLDDYTLNERFHKKQRTKGSFNENDSAKPVYTNEIIESPPHNIKLYKSSSYNALSRDFVHYFLHNETVQTFMQWIKQAWVPEEHFYASVSMIPWSPGSCHCPIESVSESFWVHRSRSPHFDPSSKCAGKIIHEVCILTSAELPRVKDFLSGETLFLNKYFMEEDHVIMDCVEEELVRRNIEQFQQDMFFLTNAATV